MGNKLYSKLPYQVKIPVFGTRLLEGGVLDAGSFRYKAYVLGLIHACIHLSYWIIQTHLLKDWQFSRGIAQVYYHNKGRIFIIFQPREFGQHGAIQKEEHWLPHLREFIGDLNCDQHNEPRLVPDS